jgi:hypothetical protein
LDDSDRVLSERAVGSNDFAAGNFNSPSKKQMIVSAVGTEHMIDGDSDRVLSERAVGSNDFVAGGF